MSRDFELSDLNKTWILDLDGTILKHNGYLEGKDEILPGAREFINNIPESDRILILTARHSKYKKYTVDFLKNNKIRYDYILFDMPNGERIIMNDIKPGGLKTAHAVNLKRDRGVDLRIKIVKKTK